MPHKRKSKAIAQATRLPRMQALQNAKLASDKEITLLEHILSTLWLSPLKIEQRSNALRNLFLVSSAFKDAFAKVLFRDPYFLNAGGYNWFLDFVNGKPSRVFDEDMATYAKENCRSMNFVCEDGKKRKYPRYDAVPYMKRDQLDGLFPNLKRVGVDYLNTVFWEPTTEWWIFFVPDTVHTLYVKYSVDLKRESYNKKEPRITAFASGPYLHYTRVPEHIVKLYVETDKGSSVLKENMYRLAAMFPNLAYLEWNGDEFPLANGPIDEDMWERLRSLPESGPERDKGVKRFAVNVARHLFQGGDQAFSDTLKMLARQEPETFARETARMAAEGRLPKLVAALKKMEEDGLFDNIV